MHNLKLYDVNTSELDYLIHFRKARRQETLDLMYSAIEQRLAELNVGQATQVNCYLAYGRRQDEIDRENAVF